MIGDEQPIGLLADPFDWGVAFGVLAGLLVPVFVALVANQARSATDSQLAPEDGFALDCCYGRSTSPPTLHELTLRLYDPVA
ncbi:hypothetical protein [Natronorubrum sp. DTA28]|uniref:hypothetical protein n=1 Tax=Natronorubrum sp. DTA28 TaxID=3447019 RepID=UPI003F86B6E2